MKTQGQQIKIIFNIDPDLKKEFKRRCLELGLDMTDVLVSGIKEFIKESKQHA